MLLRRGLTRGLPPAVATTPSSWSGLLLKPSKPCPSRAKSDRALPDERVAEAIDIVRPSRTPRVNGRWRTPTRAGQFEIDEGEGKPSRWNTLRAMRVLRWYEEPSRA